MLNAMDTGPLKRSSRAIVILNRWMIFLVALLLTGIASLLVLRWQQDELEAVLAWIAAAPAWMVWCIVSFVVLMAAGIALQRGMGILLATLGLRHPLTYPPTWPSIFLGVGLATKVGTPYVATNLHQSIVAHQALEKISLFVICSPLAALFFGFLLGACRRYWRPVIVFLKRCVRMAWTALAWLGRPIVWIFHRIRRHQPDSSSEAGEDDGDGSRIELDPDHLYEWFSADHPVTSSNDDLFPETHTRLAKRMADRLAEPDPPSQAVIGPLGSGKSSLGNLLDEALRRKTHIWVEVINVELWPYETTRAAVEGVVGSLVEALSREVNTLRLTGIPADYANAVSAVSGSVAKLLPRIRRTPIKSLNLIDEIATAIGVRYVLWVEDLERFAIGDPMQTAAESHQEAERLAPVRALLHGLDSLESVTVVTATTSLYQRFDLEKIARYVERIPLMDPQVTRRIIQALRAHWLSDDNLIDPGHSIRNATGWDSNEDESSAYMRALLADRISSLAEATLALCTTPRVLQQALRRCNETWTRLRGEIDLDAMIAMNVVREASPIGFAIIEEHIDAIRCHYPRLDDDPESHPLKRLESTLENALADGRAREAVRVIVEKTTTRLKVTARHWASMPQGFALAQHTDYWHRFQAIPDLAPSERDQEVLRIIDRGNDDDLLDIIVDPTRSPTVEHFAQRISPVRVIHLLVPLVTRLSCKNPRGWWRLDNDPPGIVSLWRILLEYARNGSLPKELAHSALLQAYREAIPRNLTLATRLEYYFASTSGDLPRLLADDEYETAKKYLRKLLLEHTLGDPKVLSNGLVDAFPYVLCWLCWGIDNMRANHWDAPLDEWTELAETILEATRLNPAVMLPQLAAIVTEERIHRPPEFAEQRCNALFGNIYRVLDLFVRIPPEAMDDRVQAVARVAQINPNSDLFTWPSGLLLQRSGSGT